VAPNTGVFWGLPTADCYAGIAPAWFVDVWGDHSRNGLVVPPLMRLGPDAILPNVAFSSVLASYGVTHLASPIRIIGPQMKEVPVAGPVHFYELSGKRTRLVPRARTVHTNREAATILVHPGFDPNREVLLHASANLTSPIPDDSFEPSDAGASASIVEEDSRHVRLQVAAPHGGYLLLADTYYPGWRATVDGASTALYRANISLRAVHLPPGARSVDFHYDAAPFFRGLKIAGTGISLLLLWLVGASYFGWKHRRDTSEGAIIQSN
jgi:hypothetical protein